MTSEEIQFQKLSSALQSLNKSLATFLADPSELNRINLEFWRDYVNELTQVYVDLVRDSL